MRLLLLCLAVGCTTHEMRPTPAPALATCTAMTFVDAEGAPLAAAEVTVERRQRLCGPSGLPEACTYDHDSVTLTTDAAGRIAPCGTLPPSAVVVRYRDWPVVRARPDAIVVVRAP